MHLKKFLNKNKTSDLSPEFTISKQNNKFEIKIQKNKTQTFCLSWISTTKNSTFRIVPGVFKSKQNF
jgi:hypothetical protein